MGAAGRCRASWPAVQRLRTILTTVLVGVGAVVLPASGCRGCTIDCEGEAPLSRTVDARVVAIEAGVVRVAPADDDSGNIDDEFEVLVNGRASALDVGETYTFPIHEEAADEVSTDDLGAILPTANLDTGCDCGAPFITNVDGSEVETGILPDVPLRKYGWAFIGAALNVVVGWGCFRLRRGDPL